MVYGHADPTGGEQYNKDLSERRARAVAAVLTHDARAFEEIYKKESWGTHGVQVCLNAVNDGSFDHLDEDGKLGPATKAAVQTFQTQNGLDPDGKPGPATRAVLFKKYFEKALPQPVSRDRLRNFGGGRFMGCSLFNPFCESGKKDELSRRVVMIVFGPEADPGKLPCALGDLGPCRANSTPPVDPPRGDDPMHFFRCSVYRKLSEKCPCKDSDGQSPAFRYGIPTGAGSPWPDDAKLRIETEDGAVVHTFDVSGGDLSKSGDDEQSYRFFDVKDPKAGQRWKGSMLFSDGTVFPLFGLVELARVIDPDDPINVLPLPESEAPAPRPGPPPPPPFRGKVKPDTISPDPKTVAQDFNPQDPPPV
jgi:hypothetical protein